MNIVFSDTNVADGSQEDDPVAKNLLFLSQRSWTCLKADVKSSAVVVNVKQVKKCWMYPGDLVDLPKWT